MKRRIGLLLVRVGTRIAGPDATISMTTPGQLNVAYTFDASTITRAVQRELIRMQKRNGISVGW